MDYSWQMYVSIAQFVSDSGASLFSHTWHRPEWKCVGKFHGFLNFTGACQRRKDVGWNICDDMSFDVVWYRHFEEQQIVTPFAQILHRLQTARNKYSQMTNVSCAKWVKCIAIAYHRQKCIGLLKVRIPVVHWAFIGLFSHSQSFAVPFPFFGVLLCFMPLSKLRRH